jgi:hypothetical protein
VRHLDRRRHLDRHRYHLAGHRRLRRRSHRDARRRPRLDHDRRRHLDERQRLDRYGPRLDHPHPDHRGQRQPARDGTACSSGSAGDHLDAGHPGAPSQAHQACRLDHGSRRDRWRLGADRREHPDPDLGPDSGLGDQDRDPAVRAGWLRLDGPAVPPPYRSRSN